MELTEQVEILEKGSRTLTQGDKALLVRFRLMSAECENLNHRIYPRDVLASAVSDLKARIAKKKDSFAMCGHKDDENVDDITAQLEDVEMINNDVFATAKVLPTQKGRNIIALLTNGAAIGVSAKCTGAMDGNRVKAGLRIRGFDWTLSPGISNFADKSSILESVEVPDETDGAVSEAQLAAFGLVEDGPLTEQNARGRFAFAVAAGYQGSFEQYSRDVLKKS